MPHIQTERTDIEFITIDDAPFFVKLVNSPEWLRFIGERNVKDSNDAEAFLKKGLLKSYEVHGYSYYLVKSKSGDSMGVCGFMKKPYLENEDFGFAFLPEFHGQGFGYESAEAILKYGVQQFEFKTLDAVTVPDNLASIGLLEKLKFSRHGNIEEPDSKVQLLLYRWQPTLV